MTVVLYLPLKYYHIITFVKNKNKKHFNQFTMSVPFCVILCYMILFPLLFPLPESVNTDGTI